MTDKEIIEQILTYYVKINYANKWLQQNTITESDNVNKKIYTLMITKKLKETLDDFNKLTKDYPVDILNREENKTYIINFLTEEKLKDICTEMFGIKNFSFDPAENLVNYFLSNF